MAGGLLLLAAALVLTGMNLLEDQQAGAKSERVRKELERQVPETLLQTAGPDVPDYMLYPEQEMPISEIGGQDYIGILEIPSLQISLPVMSQWSYENLKTAPCRYYGSAYKENMVIAGHNYRAHFGGLRSLSPGAQVKFTDMEGNGFVYEVAGIEILEPDAVEALVDEAWDLTLFTCTYGGENRVAVRCVAADEGK